MHTIKITPNLLFEYQCTSGKFIRLPNRIETFLPELECSSVSPVNAAAAAAVDADARDTRKGTRIYNCVSP